MKIAEENERVLVNVPYWHRTDNAKPTFVERTVRYIDGKPHVKMFGQTYELAKAEWKTLARRVPIHYKDCYRYEESRWRVYSVEQV